MTVRGNTVEERRQARTQRTRKNRLAFFAGEIRKAATGRQRLQQACAFAKAVADDLDDKGRTELAREIAEAAERRNAA